MIEFILGMVFGACIGSLAVIWGEWVRSRILLGLKRAIMGDRMALRSEFCRKLKRAQKAKDRRKIKYEKKGYS